MVGFLIVTVGVCSGAWARAAEKQTSAASAIPTAFIDVIIHIGGDGGLPEWGGSRTEIASYVVHICTGRGFISTGLRPCGGGVRGIGLEVRIRAPVKAIRGEAPGERISGHLTGQTSRRLRPPELSTGQMLEF